MKKQVLALVVASGMMTVPSHAVYNLYKENGLSLDINGEVNLYLEQDKASTTGQAASLAQMHDSLTDERLRLFPESGASWMDFRGSQELANDWRVTGTLGLGYATGSGQSFLNSANVSIDKLNTGAITLGRQYLHTGFVTRTGTFTPLDVFGEQAVRLDYYGTPNLHASAYYLFPSSTDTRRQSNSTKTEGFGVSGSYVIPFSSDDHSLRLAAGLSNSKANPRNLDTTSPDTTGYAASAEYRLGQFLVAADYGYKDTELGGTLLASSKSDYMGVKVGYEVTPRFNVVAGYGTRVSEAKYQAGATQAAVEAKILQDINQGGILASLGSGLLYNELEEKRGYVRGDYYLRDNVRLYGQVQKEKVQAKMQEANYAKLDDTSYRLGISLTF